MEHLLSVVSIHDVEPVVGSFFEVDGGQDSGLWALDKLDSLALKHCKA
jgi:hypothetical protein